MADNVFAKNLESLFHLADFEDTLDAAKLDAPPALLSSALRAKHDEALAAQQTVGNSKGDWRTVTLDRTVDADKLASMASQSLAALEARGASPEKIEDGRFYVRKLQGSRNTPAAVDDPTTPDVDESEQSISASQRSNAARIAMFLEYLDWLDGQHEYVGVTAAGKTISEMRAFGNAVQTKHELSITAATTLSSDRIARDKLFFEDSDSVINLGKRVKKLIGAAYGFDSPEYHTANAIPFRKSHK